jgi:hypothetical protein
VFGHTCASVLTSVCRSSIVLRVASKSLKDLNASTLRKALIPELNEGQVIWAIRIIVSVAVLVVMLVLLGIFGFVSSENATVVGPHSR